MAKRYGPGDKVFAKVRGYPPWPARVEGVADETPNKMKYHIFFYGTRETAICKADELYAYLENREKYGKPLKKKGFNEGIQQIEAELGLTPRANLLNQSVASTPGDMSCDSDAEGNLVIDETPHGNSTNKKSPSKTKKPVVLTPQLGGGNKVQKGVKRKLEADSDEPELPRIRGPSTSGGRKSNVDVLSRSGRKIRPKKFADDLDEAAGGDASSVMSGTGESDKMQGLTVRVSSGSVTSKIVKADADQKTGSAICEVVKVDDDVMIALTPGGQEVKIDLNSNKPTSFKSDKARLEWRSEQLKKAHTLKAQIESGDIIPEGVKKEVEERHKVRERMIKEVAGKSGTADSDVDRSQKLVYLRTEAQLLDIDINIKSSLSLVQADPELCLRLLDELLELQVTPLMLKKHPECVETIKKLRRYIGNTGRWNMTEEEEKVFSSKAAMIRSKAEHVFNKFRSLFTIPEGKSFREAFTKELEKFSVKTEGMSMSQIFELVNDPVVPGESEDDELQEDSKKKQDNKVKSREQEQENLQEEKDTKSDSGLEDNDEEKERAAIKETLSSSQDKSEAKEKDEDKN